MAKAGICCAVAAVAISPKRVMPSVWKIRNGAKMDKTGVFIRAFQITDVWIEQSRSKRLANLI